ncbi:MAG: gamma-glutamyltransferase, partial [Actinobacteria bacterium]|nr:gamma-glutamyltransferase [Actinomycetota bacterium]
TAAGLRILQQGGNAFDAAIAAAAVIAVVEPNSNHVGGDAFALCHPAGAPTPVAVNASGPAPAEDRPERHSQGIPAHGLESATVPGAVSAWETVLARFGTMRLADALAPAIDYAEAGFPVDYALAAALHEMREVLARFPASAAIFLPGGEPLRRGQLLAQPDLAATLRAIAADGAGAFYRGGFADALARAAQSDGGAFVREDLAGYACEVVAPVRTFYRGWEILEQPLPSQGFVVLEALNIVEGFELEQLEFGSAQLLHVLLEAKKLAFADRHAFMGDPRFVRAPVAQVLTKEFAAQRRMALDPARASREQSRGDPSNIGTDTTAITVADAHGNAIAFIQSVFRSFGSGYVVPGTGVLLNNRRTGFALDPRSPNVLAGGKRTVHTLNTYMVLREGRPALLGSSPGGHYQVQANLQIITNLLDFGMHVQEAIDAPRWYHDEETGRVVLESRFDPAVGGVLRSRGHEVRWDAPWCGHARAQAIAFDTDSETLFGATDPRWHGQVLGF